MQAPRRRAVAMQTLPATPSRGGVFENVVDSHGKILVPRACARCGTSARTRMHWDEYNQEVTLHNTHAHSIMQYQGCPVSLKPRESAEDLRPPVAWMRERHNQLHEARRPMGSKSKRERVKSEMGASPASPESSQSSSALSSPASSSWQSSPSTPEARKRQLWEPGTPCTKP